MPTLKPNEHKCWEKYLLTLPLGQRPKNPIVTAGYAGSPSITDELLNLYLSGKKTAGSSLLEDFQAAGDPIPQVGNYWICLNSKGEPRCILRTEKVVMHKFKSVPEEIAKAEGEGDLSLDYWKRVHSELYFPFLKKLGVFDLNEATVVTEFFCLVHR